MALDFMSSNRVKFHQVDVSAHLFSSAASFTTAAGALSPGTACITTYGNFKFGLVLRRTAQCGGLRLESLAVLVVLPHDRLRERHHTVFPFLINGNVNTVA